MKISFINGPFQDYSAMDLGITQLATYINTLPDHRASIIDLVFHRPDWQRYLTGQLFIEKPDIIGLSCNKLYMPYTRMLVDDCHRRGYKVVLGGHEASMRPWELIQETGAEYACTGDGETSLVSLLNGDSPLNRWPPPPVRAGRFLSEAELNQLPTPDWSLWKDLDKYLYFLGAIYAIGSRGCNHKCSFCDAWPIQEAVGGRYFRQIDPEVYARQLWAMTMRYQPRMLQLFDPVFTVDKNWLKDFAKTFKGGTPFSVFARIDQLDPERIAMLGEANCQFVRVGIEAGDERIRNEVYRKNVSNAQIRECFKWLKRYGIRATAYYILGGPTETTQTVRATIDLASELDAERTVFFVYKVLTEQGRKQMDDCGANLRLEDSDNISFGAIADQRGLPGWRVNLFQIEGYARTLPRRFQRLLKRSGWHLFPSFVRYIWRGWRSGLDIRFLVTYWVVYGDENIYE